MALGDRDDMAGRLYAGLPNGWFPPLSAAPVLNAVLAGAGQAQADAYATYIGVKSQSRIATASGAFLDMVAYDFFGSSLVRAVGQPDASFRTQIISQLFIPRATRSAMDNALYRLTGNHPTIIEGQNPSDLGGYNTGYLAYNQAGAYGSGVAYSAFITIRRPTPVSGSPEGASGYGNPQGAYTVSSSLLCYSNPGYMSISNAAIYAAANAVRPAGTIVWMNIVSPSTTTALILIDLDDGILRPL